jgi:hypothetical protein
LRWTGFKNGRQRQGRRRGLVRGQKLGLAVWNENEVSTFQQDRCIAAPVVGGCTDVNFPGQHMVKPDMPGLLREM